MKSQEKDLKSNCLKNDNIAIKVEHLFSVYNENDDNQYVSLCDNNLTLEKNKIHFIIGNSGSGKSTLVNHFNGLLKSRYGNIWIQNNRKIGNDFFIQDYFLGILNETELKTLKQNIKLKNNNVIGVFSQNIPKRLIKILFDAYYKFNIVKIKKIKNLKFKEFTFYILEFFNKEKDLIILDKLKFSDLENFKKSENKKSEIIKNLYFAKQKIKNIKKLKKTVGLVFQFPEYQLFKDTVLNDVMFGPITLGEKKEVAKEKSIYYLKKLLINESLFANSPFNLSGGQKRRVAIAGILAFDPEILIFDEPTAGLDPAGEQEILKIIKDAKKDNKTVVVISHNMDHVLEIADNVVVINDGEIIDTGKPYKIFKNKNLLKQINIDPPMIIDLIEKMSKQTKKFKKLYEFEPKNVNQLALAIKNIINQ